jgi:hypothetical protein
MVPAVILVVLVVPAVIFGARLGRRLGTPPGATPPKIQRAPGPPWERRSLFARPWHILMEGSIVVAAEGDTQAAQRGKSMARQLIEQYR